MKIALAAARSIDHDIEQNMNTLKTVAREAKDVGADLVLVGEAFLHGFGAMTFNYAEDVNKCMGIHGEEISILREWARELQIAIGFGFFENSHGAIYCSYVILDEEGHIMLHYRRVSKGWKLPHANAEYREGKDFKTFKYKGLTLGVAICGDLWDDPLLTKAIAMDEAVDLILWPVHCDFDTEHWENSMQEEYAERSAIFAKPLLFVNNYRTEEDQAKGGTYVWRQGKTLAELPMGSPGMVIVDTESLA